MIRLVPIEIIQTIAYLHAPWMVKLIVTENVIIRNLLLTNPAILLLLLVTLCTAGLVLPHKEYLAQLDCAVFAPETGLVVQLAKSKESILSQGLGAGGTLF